MHVQAHPITVTKAELEAAVQEERFQVRATGAWCHQGRCSSGIQLCWLSCVSSPCHAP